MKKNIKTYSILLFVSILIAGCTNQPDNKSVSTPTPNSNQASKQTEQKPDILNITTKLKEPAFGGVDAVNGVVIPKSGSVIPITGDKIEIAGNYVDAVKGDVAAGVIVLIDNKKFVSTYGGERPDIAKAQNNPKYLKSQFYLSIPTAELGKGQHNVKIQVIANDMSGYYESDWNAVLDVK